MPKINVNPTQIKLPEFQRLVDQKLIRGRAVSCPYRLYRMKSQGINQIIDLGQNSIIKHLQEKFFCKLFGIKLFTFEWSFKSGELQPHKFFENINKLITSNKGKTYIHCKHGRHRTGIAVAVYEKAHTTKTDAEIIENFIRQSEDLSLAENKIVHRNKNVVKIVQSMMQRYFQKYLNEHK